MSIKILTALLGSLSFALSFCTQFIRYKALPTLIVGLPSGHHLVEPSTSLSPCSSVNSETLVLYGSLTSIGFCRGT